MDFDFELRFIAPTLEGSGGTDFALLLVPGRGVGRDPRLTAVIDALGVESARAQVLSTPITTAAKLATAAPEHTALVAYAGRTAMGIIKLGRKELFLAHHGTLHERTPLCVLDFFVPASCRRRGVGKVLMDAALRHFAVEPRQLAYDRPSHMFLSFLARHFGLRRYDAQANNFVVFEQFWGPLPADDSARGAADAPPAPSRGVLGAPTVSVAASPVRDARHASGAGAGLAPAPAPAPAPTIPRGFTAGAGVADLPPEAFAPMSVYGARSAPPTTPTRPTGSGAGGGSVTRYTPAAAAAPFATDYNSPGAGGGVLSPYNTRGLRAGGR